MANSKEKDKYYLKHDYNAASDPEIIQMMSVYGFSGYGMYWRLNEALRAEAEFKLKLTGKYVWNGFGEMLKLPADEAKKFIEDCITEFSLYESDSEYFWSNRLLNDMGLLEAKRETARNAGIESAKRRKAFFDQKNREANG